MAATRDCTTTTGYATSTPFAPGGSSCSATNAELMDQLYKLEHAMLAGFTHDPLIRLLEELSNMTGNVICHAVYTSNGTSVEIALKMSFHAWRNVGRAAKQEFVSLQGSYHGETIGALAVTDVAVSGRQ